MFGNNLYEMGNLIDWESFRPLLNNLYGNDIEKGGRPNTDPIMMLKTFFIQGLYNIVDEHIGKELHNRISFMHFMIFSIFYRMQGLYGFSVRDYHTQGRIQIYGKVFGNNLT